MPELEKFGRALLSSGGKALRVYPYDKEGKLDFKNGVFMFTENLRRFLETGIDQGRRAVDVYISTPFERRD